jgi:hypothetical protein
LESIFAREFCALADVNPAVNRRAICILAAGFACEFYDPAARCSPVRRGWSREIVRGGDGTFGGQDKRTAAKLALSGCLHIVFDGTNALFDGAIVGWRARKVLILLGGSGWQAGGCLVPNASKPLNH